MAQGRSTKTISMIKWIRTSRLSKKTLSLREKDTMIDPLIQELKISYFGFGVNPKSPNPNRNQNLQTQSGTTEWYQTLRSGALWRQVLKLGVWVFDLRSSRFRVSCLVFCVRSFRASCSVFRKHETHRLRASFRVSSFVFRVLDFVF